VIDVPARPRTPSDLVARVAAERLRVFWIADTPRDIRQLLDSLLAPDSSACLPVGSSIHHAIGEKSYRHQDGGWIRFITPHANLHGWSDIDLVVDGTTAGRPSSAWGRHFLADVDVLVHIGGATLIGVDRG
jgi:hypothetical protein